MTVVSDHFPVWWGMCVCGWQPDFAAAVQLRDQLDDHLIEHGWVVRYDVPD